MNIAVNARFRRQPVTGVQRYGHELCDRLKDRLIAIEPRPSGRGMVGHLWEQAVLPQRVGPASLLWSPTNTGPLAVKRQVVTIHDLSVLDHPEWFSPRFAAWYRFLLPRLARNVQHILTDSGFSKSRIVERLDVPPCKVTAIPLGVGPEFRPSPTVLGKKGISLSRLPSKYVAVVGSLEPRKNLARVFEAWRQIHVTFPDVTLLVLGGSGKSFRGRGFDVVPDGVELAGYVPAGDLPVLYSQALGFVYASLYEGFGLPVLEAMACGTPVVCSNKTSLPEVAGEAALLVDPTDTEEIADAIARLIDDAQLRATLSAKGLAHARAFSWDVTAEKTWDILVKQAEVDT